MDITQLRYFLKTVETMNYTRAAESLFISRQALRQALSALERELGQPLFQNERNHLSLTGHGEYLFHTFGDLVRDFEEREGRTKEFFRGPTELQVIIAASLTPYFLPNLDQTLKDFRTAYPYLSLTAQVVSDDEALDAVERGEVDLGCFIQMPVERPGCTAVLLRSVDAAVNSGPQSPLHGKEALTLEDLAGVTLLSMGSLERMAKPLWQDCQRRGIALDYRVVSSTIDTFYLLRNSPASGFGGFRGGAPRVDADPLISKARLPGYTWEIVALCPKARPNHAAARVLAEFLREKYQS